MRSKPLQHRVDPFPREAHFAPVGWVVLPSGELQFHVCEQAGWLTVRWGMLTEHMKGHRGQPRGEGPPRRIILSQIGEDRGPDILNPVILVAP